MKKITIYIIISILITGCLIDKAEPKKVSYYKYIDKAYLKKLRFSKDNLATVKINRNWYYVRPDGRAILVIDNKGRPDPFKEGLARTKFNGKIGFFNRNLDIVIEPLYNFAFPFHNGISEVCIGCKNLKYYNTELLDGGEWKRINRKGIIIEEVTN
jgi:hypothetical protein